MESKRECWKSILARHQIHVAIRGRRSPFLFYNFEISNGKIKKSLRRLIFLIYNFLRKAKWIKLKDTFVDETKIEEMQINTLLFGENHLKKGVAK